ncbi:MAG TPA: sugar phosphate nucleotidyltransferase [Candidatus Omnitrophota bacterium]|nr:sugar phosphate nucleotidyltransferase [Candidatus Omnitrophota bacterium]HPT07422.1 sugar phosphate nucleotidyltransferase [Candidatus Omnitrophota bacterium]
MKSPLIGVIPAAGKGIRLHPNTLRTHKTLLEVGGISLIARNIAIMRDDLQINHIYILIGEKKDQFLKHLGNGEKLGVHLSYLVVPAVDKGLAIGLQEIAPYVEDTVCVILGDEFYHQTNHASIRDFLNADFSAVCAIKEETSSSLIKKNYSVTLADGVIADLEEKPAHTNNTWLGCGTYLFKKTFFRHIAATPPSLKTNRVELTDVINQLAKTEKNVLPFMLTGTYVNVNSIDDYNTAQYILRALEFKQKKISLIMPCYNEAASIGHVIDEFKERVDEIIVVNNTSEDASATIAAQKGARVLTGSFKGYGDALKYGMDNASGDILILVEADGSFLARDLGKILEYLKDADMVLGTRTTKQMIEQAANMSFLLRWGNVCVAKLIELLWLIKNQPRLTDVGCTYRGIWRSSYREIRDHLVSTGPDFSPEMIIEAMRHNKRVIEIPVTYTGRVGGESKFSKSMRASMQTALTMLRMIVRKKMRDIFRFLP